MSFEQRETRAIHEMRPSKASDCGRLNKEHVLLDKPVKCRHESLKHRVDVDLPLAWLTSKLFDRSRAHCQHAAELRYLRGTNCLYRQTRTTVFLRKKRAQHGRIRCDAIQLACCKFDKCAGIFWPAIYVVPYQAHWLIIHVRSKGVYIYEKSPARL